MMPRVLLLNTAVFALGLAAATSLPASPLQWTGTGPDYLWSNAADWKLGRPFTDGTDVVFGQSAGANRFSFVGCRFAATANFAMPGGKSFGTGGEPLTADQPAERPILTPSVHFAGPFPRNSGSPPLLLTLPRVGISTNGTTTRTWGGNIGPDDRWSLGSNWLGGVAPVDGDSVVFNLNTPQAAGTARVDYTLSLDSFTKADGADPNTITIGPAGAAPGAGAAPVVLTLTGLGLINNPTPGGPLTGRQVFFISGAGADGVTGSSLVFANSSTITGQQGAEITARAGTAAGAGGGNLVFQDHAVTVTPGTFYNPSLFFAEGASVAGAAGGTIILRDDARSPAPASFQLYGGSGAGAGGGRLLVQDRARIENNNVSLDFGTDGGAGATADFSGHAVLATAGLYVGLGGNGDGPLARFRGDAQFVDGVVQTSAALGPTLAGGRLEFRDRATFVSTDPTPGFGVSIYNSGARIAGAAGGRTDFYDDSAITGPQARIINYADSESPQPGSQGGATVFHDRASAGAAEIQNEGAAVAGAGTTGGQTFFQDNATAATATLTAFAGTVPDAPGGLLVFSGNATGGTARVVLDGNGTLDISGTTRAILPIGSLEGTGGIVNLGAATLAVGGNGLSTDFAGAIGGTGGAFTKEGTGVLTLSGVSTYTGNTRVTAGGLFVNGSVASPLVSVTNGATLGGNGTLLGRADLAAGATLAPGSVAAPGIFSVGSLISVTGSQFNFRLGNAGNDRVDVTSNLLLAGTLNVAASGTFTAGTYRLFNYGGALSGSGLTFGTFPAGFDANDFRLDTGTAGQVNLLTSGGSTLLYWDGPGTVANNAVDGGAGTWNNGSTNWTNAGGSFNRNWAGKTAVFAGPAGGVVTITENVAATGLTFATDGYTINADAGRTLTLSGTMPLLVNTGVGATSNAPLTGSGTLLKQGPGVARLTADSDYTGGTTVALGRLEVGNANGFGLGTGPVSVLAGNGGAELRFVGAASAGNVFVNNNAATAADAFSGQTTFSENSRAGTANITNRGSAVVNGSGFGATYFNGSTSADQSVIFNGGGEASGARGGYTAFSNSSTAGAATITNARGPGAPDSGAEGITRFFDQSRAGTASIFNQGGTASGLGGALAFFSFAGADHASITNEGAAASGDRGGLTIFTSDATAGAATLRQTGGTVSGAGGGTLEFSLRATAADAVITNGGGLVSGALGGTLTFNGNDLGQPVTAGRATITNQAGTVNGAGSGATTFTGVATAGAASVTNAGGTTANRAGGTTTFTGADATHLASGDTATIFNRAATVTTATGGITLFNAFSTAGNATIFNDGAGVGTNTYRIAGTLQFSNASAGTANITNGGSTVADGSEGITFFLGSSTAAGATIVNQGGGLVSRAFGGFTVFSDISTAATATITALGGTTDGAFGGQIFFTDSSSAAQSTLRASGATTPGALGGAIGLNNTSSGGSARVILDLGGTLSISNRGDGGTTVGSIEGAGDVRLGTKQLTVGGNNLSTTFSGSIRDSGALVKTGLGTLTLSGTSTYTGSTTVMDGVLNITGSSGFSLGNGPVTILASPTSELRFSAAGSAGAVSITNVPGSGSYFGVTRFYSDSTASAATIFNQGTSSAGGSPGQTRFFGTSTAGSAAVENRAASVTNGTGGQLVFQGSATAGGATLNNRTSAFTGNGSSGSTAFFETSDAGTATINNEGGRAVNAQAGITFFYDNASANGATIHNAPGLVANSFTGNTQFYTASTAGNAHIFNDASAVSGAFGGVTEFHQRATAGNAAIISAGGTVNGALGSTTRFFDASTAGTATLTLGGGTTANAAGGSVQFLNTASAGQANFIVNGALVANAGGGTLSFQGDDASHLSTANSAAITNFAAPTSGAGGMTTFASFSTADGATITNQGGNILNAPVASSGRTLFFAASAGNATITNQGGAASGNFGGGTLFQNGATAATATFSNLGSTASGGSGGYTQFINSTSAANASLTANGGTVSGANGGYVVFYQSSTAGNAILTFGGGTAPGAGGGYAYFFDNATAANSTFVVNGGTNGGAGGAVYFSGNSTGGTARFTINAGGKMDISGQAGGVGLGSLEGAGTVFLGSNRLSIGGAGRSTTFSGLIADGGYYGGSGGRLGVSGAGTTLTLSGANTYTGQTTIGGGGKLIATNLTGSATGSGPVVVQNGGTLSGSGHVGGPVTLQAGGVIAPGDPTTLKLENDLIWDGGGTIRLVLGADQAGSDLLIITGLLERGDMVGGMWTFDLVNDGAVIGQSYELVKFGGLQGFSASDFRFTGVAGDFVINGDGLEFTVNVVPEPGTIYLLVVLGTVSVSLVRIRRSARLLSARTWKWRHFLRKILNVRILCNNHYCKEIQNHA